MGLKGKLILLCALGAAALWGCAQNAQNHAPVCPYGQVLAYDVTGYNCHFETMGMAANTYQAVQQTGSPTAVLTPPIQACPAGQTLIYWSSTVGCAGVWLCYYQQEIYPPGGASPQSNVPPAGMGGEYCTGGTVGSYAYGYAYANSCNNVTGNLTVSCSPGYQCQAGGTNGVSSIGSVYGQGGTCVYTGYHGY